MMSKWLLGVLAAVGLGAGFVLAGPPRGHPPTFGSAAEADQLYQRAVDLNAQESHLQQLLDFAHAELARPRTVNRVCSPGRAGCGLTVCGAGDRRRGRPGGRRQPGGDAEPSRDDDHDGTDHHHHDGTAHHAPRQDRPTRQPPRQHRPPPPHDQAEPWRRRRWGVR